MSKRIAVYTATYFAYKVPYDRTARIYESEEPVFKGCHFEVSTHSGGVAVDWEFKPFKNIEDAQAYALQFIAPPHILCKFKPQEN